MGLAGGGPEPAAFLRKGRFDPVLEVGHPATEGVLAGFEHMYDHKWAALREEVGQDVRLRGCNKIWNES